MDIRLLSVKICLIFSYIVYINIEHVQETKEGCDCSDVVEHQHCVYAGVQETIEGRDLSDVV